jgi:OmpA-OmpF porin, OOP family
MSRRTSLLGAALAYASAALFPAAASAQDKTFNVDRLYMAGAPDDGVGVWRPEMGGSTRLFGQFGLGLAINPLRTDNFVDELNKEATLKGNPLTSQLIGYFNAGAQIFDRFMIQASFPVAFYQTGNPTANAPDVDSRLRLSQSVALSTAAPMDLRLEARVLVYRNPDKNLKFGLLAGAYLPTGNKYSLTGDGAAGGIFGVSAEYDIQKKYVIAANAGVRIRPFANLNELNVSHEFVYGLAAYVPLSLDRIRVGLELFGATGIDGGKTFPPDQAAYATDQTKNAKNAGDLDTSPLEWNVNGRMYFTKLKQVHVGVSFGSRLDGGYSPDFRAVAMIGGWFNLKDTDMNGPGFVYVDDNVDTDHDGYPDNIDMCPNDPEDHKGANPSDGCPQLPDKDTDGVPDISDKCPSEAEDFDNIDDRDGCPEDDADKDGIPDGEDKCPKEPGETAADDPEKNGCPHYIRRITGSAEIQIMKQVEFKFDSFELLPISFPILDEVVRLLQVNTEIKLVSIEGHTDNQGKDEYNDRLSKDRARAVREYIVKKGVDPSRVTSTGFGAKMPLMGNDTDAGRAKNRRVEFHIKTQTIEGR